MYDLRLSEGEVKLIRWSIQVAADAVSQQEDGPIPVGDAMGLIAHLEALDSLIYESVKPQKAELFGYEQMSFDDS